ncbi:MAG: tetratricopeptide repeat protein [bacterium]
MRKTEKLLILMAKTWILLVIVAALTGCARVSFEEASQMQKQGLLLNAAEAYSRFADRNPADPKAPEALFRAAEIYAKEFQVCSKAVPLYERVARNYADAKPWHGLAKRGFFSCPNYFPLQPGMKWVYGDAQTGGRNMKQSALAKPGPGGIPVVETSIYAGKKLVTRITRTYTRKDWELTEKEKGTTHAVPILKFPVSKGRTWTARRGPDTLIFTVENDNATVKLRKAGRFTGCIKVRRQIKGMSAWIYEYYAPGVGRVLTSVGGPGFEHRNTELINYEKEGK